METKQQAACYIRVSTEEQTEYSPEAQRRALEGYARRHGYSIDPAHVYVDAGISGRRAETRPLSPQPKESRLPLQSFSSISLTGLPGIGRTALSTNPSSAGSVECR